MSFLIVLDGCDQNNVMYSFSSYLLLLFPFLLVFSCNRDNKCPEQIYLPVSVEPVQSVYKIDDTITINSQFPRMLTDISGDKYTFEDEIGFSFSVASVTGKSNQTSEYVEVDTSNNIDLNHLYSSESDSYYGVLINKKDSVFVNIKLNLRKKGIVNLCFKVEGGGPPLEASKNCIRGFNHWSPWVMSMNDGVNHNFELLSELDSATVKALQRDPQQYNESGCYLMKIVE